MSKFPNKAGDVKVRGDIVSCLKKQTTSVTEKETEMEGNGSGVV